MKIAIFYEKTEKQYAETVERIIKEHNCMVESHQTNKVWQSAVCKNPPLLLQGITHVLFMFADRPYRDPAFLFFFGMAIGRNLPIIILQRDKPIVVPANCRNFVMILTIDAFDDYFTKEQNHFLSLEAKRLARNELLARGYPCFDSNFVAAVTAGNDEIVLLFLQAGFDPSLRDNRGTPVLSLAVRESHYKTALLLLSHGAEINLCAEDREYSALMEAAQLGDMKTAELLLSRNADINIQSKDGQTALILAVGRKDIPMVTILAKHKADWLIQDSLGMSALGYAKLFHHPEILQLAETYMNTDQKSDTSVQ